MLLESLFKAPIQLILCSGLLNRPHHNSSTSTKQDRMPSPYPKCRSGHAELKNVARCTVRASLPKSQITTTEMIAYVFPRRATGLNDLRRGNWEDFLCRKKVSLLFSFLSDLISGMEMEMDMDMETVE